ncbi:MAG: indolepyruvate ferredoxin oxidoreductase family protein [Burkholderiales bacterium]|nr:indolepyruvate ferredoxin oxidoreductase family protein [Burkholderiales bacterium]
MSAVADTDRARPALADVTLDDKYRLERGRVYLTGIQALVRLAMLQRERDARAGLNTAGFVSGYRGSPLGGLDQALAAAGKHLEQHHIVFRPGVNEDLAATAIWGTQQVNLFAGAKYDGVFGMWYGKGPGVDRCGDVFRHANAAGTSRHGGVLALAGDDHAAKSSTLPHQTDHVFKAVMMPLLYPASVQDYLDLGVHGFAMSRYSGCWVGFKCVTDVVESSASVYVDPDRVRVELPTGVVLPPDGLNIRWPDPFLVQEERLLHHKLYAALAYCRANGLNRVVIDSPRPRLGIITSGKAYMDVRQALEDLGIDERLAAEIGIRLYKCGMIWPLESEGVRRFAQGLEEILVVEEKRQFLEYQLKEELYNFREDVRPRVIGKFDEKGEWALPHGEWLLPAASELSPAVIARAIASRIARFYTSDRIKARLAFLEAKEQALARPRVTTQRIPYFCSGCPHNTSTRVPEGSRATAGIGCHFMAVWMDRNTATFSHMGGEGVAWIGQAPFTETSHIFANLGDGTYYHSGILAIRAAVAAKVPITYKILYNDAVAMTGGQKVDGPLSVPDIVRQVAAEGVERIVVVTDQPEKYRGVALAPAVPVRHRDELDRVQRELREFPGVSVLVYDQTCAAEKRRRRKRGTFPDPAMRAFINELVCEGCGDCGVKSNCVAVEPLETEFGRKRVINQSACNKDFSCVKGFCPSFVTLEGAQPRRGKALAGGADDWPALPEPQLPATERPYGVLVTGVGGTGVVTIGALLGMAAHLEGKGVTVLDMTGLAQKNGAVMSHVRFGNRPEDIHAVRIAAGEADLVLGCDMVVAASPEALAKMQAGRTRLVINSAAVPTADFTRNPDWTFPGGDMQAELTAAVGGGSADFVDATRLATALMGDAIATNLFMLGYAWQKGLVPVSAAAIERAIELNGVAVDANRKSFQWGRRAAHDAAAVAKVATPAEVVPLSQRLSRGIDEVIARRVEFLTDYQDAAYAERYRKLVDRVRQAEADRIGGTKLAEAVARCYFKLLAYKDEYEVARLYTRPEFRQRLEAAFEGDYRLRFHLAPPLLARPDPVTGEPRKRAYGPWVIGVFEVLARLKWLRGTAFDLFGYGAERRRERQLVAEYERTVETLLAHLNRDTHATAVAIASLPEEIRGFGPVKARHLERTKAKEAELLARLEAAAAAPKRVAA